MRFGKKFAVYTSFSVVLCCILYWLFHYSVRSTTKSDVFSLKTKNITTVTDLNRDYYHVWITFTKAATNGGLTAKFDALLESILSQSRGVSLHFNLITDADSEHIARSVINRLLETYHVPGTDPIVLTFYDAKWCASKIQDIIDCMKPHFSSRAGSYYSDALFYLSLGLHRIAPHIQQRVVMLDCDLVFKINIKFLFQEFEKFTSDNLFGLSYELSSVYRHVLYNYRSKNVNTRFGSEINFYEKIKKHKANNTVYINKNEIISNDVLNTNITSNMVPLEVSLTNDFDNDKKYFVSKSGFPGFNSGVVMLDLDKMRNSQLYQSLLKCNNIQILTEKYMFKGHLGDQDFFTLLGYDKPNLFYVLNCGWNRQLCKWWRRYEDVDIFDDYFKCDADIKIHHGNCNSPIPKH